MDIGIGLPTTLAVDGPAVLDWARRAEDRGFSALATIDRFVYPNYDSLTALAAAAGATSRIGLFTDILLAPAYPPVWLAKATGSLHALSAGRLTLGLGVGGRPDDFAAVDRSFDERGRLMDETLELLHSAWGGTAIGDHPVSPAARCRSWSAATGRPRSAGRSSGARAGPSAVPRRPWPGTRRRRSGRPGPRPAGPASRGWPR
jgi:alkanesulfonate monooxygenase SsuD/methylene tetrahydromethanopterin reductase-like flavin-dependent oxidoreductase (luciferase family)